MQKRYINIYIYSFNFMLFIISLSLKAGAAIFNQEMYCV